MKTIAIAGLLVALAGSAAAQGVPPNLLADANNDGKVSKQEYVDSRRKAIMRADHDRDGKVSAAEWKRAADLERMELQEAGADGASRVGKGGWFQAIDANKDGFVTPQEIDTVSNARFPKLDLNGDGYVDRIEAQKLARRVMN